MYQDKRASDHEYMYVGVSMLPVSVNVILEIRNVLTVRYIVHSIYCSECMTMTLLTLNVCTYYGIKSHLSVLNTFGGRRGHDHGVAFTTSYAIAAYHHMSCEFDSRGELYSVQRLYDNICQ